MLEDTWICKKNHQEHPFYLEDIPDLPDLPDGVHDTWSHQQILTADIFFLSCIYPIYQLCFCLLWSILPEIMAEQNVTDTQPTTSEFSAISASAWLGLGLVLAWFWLVLLLG